MTDQGKDRTSASWNTTLEITQEKSGPQENPLAKE